jgi:tyrosine-protein kinase
MQSSDIRSIMRRFWVAVVALALVGAVGGAYYELGRPAAYVSTIRVFTSNKLADNVPVSQTTNLAVQRMGSYVPLVGSTELAQRIIDQLQLRDTPLKVARSLSATFDKDTVLMTVSAKASTPQESEAIVRALPGSLTDLVSSLTKTGQAKDESPTLFTTFDGPSTAKTRSLPKILLSTAFGLVVGTSIGAAVASLLARRQRGVTSPEQLRDITASPVVGIIPKDGTFDPISVPASSRRHRWDAYRRLAYNLRVLVPQSRPYVVVVTGSGSGVGTSDTAVGLASALAGAGEDVLYVDANRSEPSSSEGADEHEREPRVAHSTNASAAVAGLTRTAVARDVLLARHGVELLLTNFRGKFDVTVVDAPPVLTHVETATLAVRADAVLLVTDQFGTPAADVVAAAEALRAMGSGTVGGVLNRVEPSSTPDSRLRAGVSLIDSSAAQERTVSAIGTAGL